MGARELTHSRAWRIALVVTTLAFSGCEALNDARDAIDDIGNDADVYYYLSLGDSLSVGVQPNSSGVALPTNDGYADQLFDLIRRDFEAGGPNRELRLVKLGCPGETVDDMRNGGNCPFLAGSQLGAAVDFLEDNGARVHLVTIDIGGNDFRNADCIGAVDAQTCATNVSVQIAADLEAVLTALNNAADPATTIVGMNYYNPYLASWLVDAAGQTLAMESAQAISILTDYLNTTYDSAGALVADVATAFQSDDFTTIVPTSLPAPNDQLPVSVANVCQWTYVCDADPDIHANNAGYAVIAETFEATLP